jgi:hypothetical protein
MDGVPAMCHTVTEIAEGTVGALKSLGGWSHN